MELTKERIKKDRILKEGFEYRKQSNAYFYASSLFSLLFLAVRLQEGYDVFVVLLFIVACTSISYVYYRRKFRNWELQNADYIKQLGFEVKA